jgi:hypothetical protein
VFWLFPKTGLAPYDSFPHHTFTVFLFSIICILVISPFTKPKPASELQGVNWDKSALTIPESERSLNRGLRDFRLWWLIMVLVITTLYVLTYSRANKTQWLEAENQNYTTTGSGKATVQHRSEVSGFNLWTGQKSPQVLFQPAAAGDAITFRLPVKQAGPHRIAAMVTRGPYYGTFTASVNDSPSTITLNRTVAGAEERTFVIQHPQTREYDANTTGTPDKFGAPQGRTVIDRIDLGVFPLDSTNNKLTFKLSKQAAVPGKSFIGIDQLMITPTRED